MKRKLGAAASGKSILNLFLIGLIIFIVLISFLNLWTFKEGWSLKGALSKVASKVPGAPAAAASKVLPSNYPDKVNDAMGRPGEKGVTLAFDKKGNPTYANPILGDGYSGRQPSGKTVTFGPNGKPSVGWNDPVCQGKCRKNYVPYTDEAINCEKNCLSFNSNTNPLDSIRGRTKIDTAVPGTLKFPGFKLR